MKVEILKDKQEYGRLHYDIFGRSDVEMPPVVFVGRRISGDAVGFMAGFWNTHDHFYIQYAGILPEYQKHSYLRYFAGLLDDSVEYSLSVKNTNVVAIMTALKVGFIPVGFYLKKDTYFIQLERGKING